jgi:mRNA (2'-O-methyladenosine-N6-)-methyltransferase
MDSNDTWSDLQAFKRRQTSLREKMQRRKKEREDLLMGSQSNSSSQSLQTLQTNQNSIQTSINQINCEEIERKLLQYLCDQNIKLPIDSNLLTTYVSKSCNIAENCHQLVKNLLQKFSLQDLIVVKEGLKSETDIYLIITSLDHLKLISFGHEIGAIVEDNTTSDSKSLKRSLTDSKDNDSKMAKISVNSEKSEDLLESLLSLPTIREKQNKKMGEEILALLSKPTAKERSLVEQFRSVGGAQVQEFCQHGTKEECIRLNNSCCPRLHFKKIIQKHTDELLGDCSFLNTCFHMDSCKYVHYLVDYSTLKPKKDSNEQLSQMSNISSIREQRFKRILFPAQWMRCDLRYFDMSILGIN